MNGVRGRLASVCRSRGVKAVAGVGALALATMMGGCYGTYAYYSPAYYEPCAPRETVVYTSAPAPVVVVERRYAPPPPVVYIGGYWGPGYRHCHW